MTLETRELPVKAAHWRKRKTGYGFPKCAAAVTVAAALPSMAQSSDDIDRLLSLEGDPLYGEYLASECTSCHNVSGIDRGIPVLSGWTDEDLAIALHSYRVKDIEHPVMNMIAGRLGDEEIAALAAYFATLEE